ncbi:Uma2 family endonuclease [Nodosilinea sp. P-1105]|uniref:Uma2 family endonuclease n=1 Tax=Nodosilinea sp. P-1105 TaxID=2546229 RepID=UPI00146D8390|nr:Uma2 family endonuclease [Nodosilinea sp. P-1105]NMF85540.1 Uma2 family endonuclease [Nodosilinea sp. P-1105]
MTQSLSPSPQSPTDLRPDVTHLVIEDETPVDNFLSAKLQRLLVEILYSSWASLGLTRPFVADADIGIFASVNQPPIVPDVFVALDVEAPQDFRQKRNRTYLVWEFGKSPDVVLEIVSNREGNELGRKLGDYERLGVSYYLVFDPLQQLGEELLRVFGLHEGHYVPLAEPWLEQVGLGLTLWEGEFEGVTTTWLRWCDRDGNLLPTGAERAEQERLRAEQAEAKAARLAARLQELGIEPD